MMLDEAQACSNDMMNEYSGLSNSTNSLAMLIVGNNEQYVRQHQPIYIDILIKILILIFAVANIQK